MRTLLILIIFGSMVLSACGDQADKPGKVLSRPGEPDVVSFAGSDQEMNAAIAQAQKTIEEFISDLGKKEGAGVKRSLKVRFDTGKEPEHIWVGDVKVTGQGFEGVLENEPVDIKGLKAGDKVTFSKNQISDWLVISEGKVKGGFTIKAIRKRMSPSERRAFDEQTDGAFKE